MKTPITSCPCLRSKWAATLLSTPPDMASTMRGMAENGEWRMATGD
jgi:hypothetical protein